MQFTFQMGKGWKEYMNATDAKRFQAKFARMRRKALQLVAVEIMEWAIESGSSNFARNAQLTIEIKGGSTPMRDQRKLLRKALKTKMVGQSAVFIGVPQGSRYFGIVKGLHDGMTIPVTEKMRLMFFALAAVSNGTAPASMLTGRAKELYKRKPTGWRQISRGTKVIRIPGRPFIAEAFDNPYSKALILRRFSEAVDQTLAELARTGA